MAFRGGDIVYFKECKNSSHRKAQGARFKGVGFGIFLGHVGPFEKDPTRDNIVSLVGACGYLTFDDVADFLGEDQARLCVAKFEEKYYPKQEPTVKGPDGKEVPVVDDTPSGLVGLNGQPLEKPSAGPAGLLIPAKDMAAIRQSMQKSPGQVKPLLTMQDLQKQIKAMSPEQIRKAMTDAKASAEIQLARPLTEKEVDGINAKVCGALGVDPVTLERIESSGETAGLEKQAEAAPGETNPANPPPENAPAEETPPDSDPPPIFPKRQLPNERTQ
jgi:hypothetical protein